MKSTCAGSKPKQNGKNETGSGKNPATTPQITLTARNSPGQAGRRQPLGSTPGNLRHSLPRCVRLPSLPRRESVYILWAAPYRHVPWAGCTNVYG